MSKNASPVEAGDSNEPGIEPCYSQNPRDPTMDRSLFEFASAVAEELLWR